MIIEVLDSNGAVITKVANVDNPNGEVKSYGGVSWREHVKSDNEVLAESRGIQINDINAHAMNLISGIMPVLGNRQIIDLMSVLWPILNTELASSEILRARDIHVYAKNRIQQAKSATQVQLDTYDVENDPAWP